MDVYWQHEFKDISGRGLHLLQLGIWADCRFLVGGASQNRKLIAAHKLILAMASPVFERMFYGQLADKDDPIIIPDVQPDAFEALLQYIYSNRINISSFDKACELCYVAKKYMLPHVVEQCTTYLWSQLRPNNACRAYEFAKLFDEPHLMQSSMQLIADRTLEVLADPGFTDIEVSTLMAILDQQRLNIDSELDLFNALLSFANERNVFRNESTQNSRLIDQNSTEASNGVGMLQAEEIKMEPDVSAMMQGRDDDVNYNYVDPSPEVVVVDSDIAVAGPSENEIDVLSSSASYDQPSPSAPSTSDVANASNLNYYMETCHTAIDEEMMEKAVKKIRFLTMTPQQFAEGPARSRLLRQHEALTILIKLSSSSFSNCPMPEGFCNSRCSRNYCGQRGSQRDVSIFLHAHSLNYVPLGNICVCGGLCNSSFELCSEDVRQQNASSNRNFNMLPPLNYNRTRDNRADFIVATNETFVCLRTAKPQYNFRNTNAIDCGLTFQVDANIWITGIQVPTQVLPGELLDSPVYSDGYTEIVYALLQDMQGSRLRYTHHTAHALYNSILDISFDHPVLIMRNLIYKVFVVFNKEGWYPMSSSIPDVICNRVKFRFNVGDQSESVRDGLIRGIVFVMPQDITRNLE